MRTSLIVAEAENGVIGRAGDLPWHLPADLRRFRALTLGHVLVAGRITHESILARVGGPLADRVTVVVTSRHPPGLSPTGPVVYRPTVAAALSTARATERLIGRDEVFVIGGAAVYAAALPEIDTVYLTRVHIQADGDASMPAGWLDRFTPASPAEPGRDTDGPPFTFQRYDVRPGGQRCT